MDYDKLKKDTYLFLLGNSIKAKRLVYATLLIALCHDKCIKDVIEFQQKHGITDSRW